MRVWGGGKGGGDGLSLCIPPAQPKLPARQPGECSLPPPFAIFSLIFLFHSPPYPFIFLLNVLFFPTHHLTFFFFFPFPAFVSYLFFLATSFLTIFSPCLSSPLFPFYSSLLLSFSPSAHYSLFRCFFSLNTLYYILYLSQYIFFFPFIFSLL